MRIGLICLMTSCFFCSRAQVEDSLRKTLENYRDKAQFDGSVLVADIDGVLFQQAYGWADIENGYANHVGSTFPVGQLEQVFTALLCLQLVEEGLLHLDSSITSYIPEFISDWGQNITLFHLLTHTSGIPDFTTLPGIWNDSLRKKIPTGHILFNFCSKDLLFSPGTNFQQSQSNYFILGQIIERLTDRPLEWLMKAYILEPAGMSQTGLGHYSSEILYPTQVYYRLGGHYLKAASLERSNLIGTSSLYTNAFDLYLWDRSLYGRTYLSDTSMNTYLSPVFYLSKVEQSGFGWLFEPMVLAKGDSTIMMYTEGTIQGYRAGLYRLPDRGICIIILCNSGFENLRDLLADILRILNRQSPKPVIYKQEQWHQLIQKKGVSEWLQSIDVKQLPTKDKFAFLRQLEALAQRLLLLGKHEETERIFSWMYRQFPDYLFGRYYSGKIYLQLGEHHKAVPILKALSSEKPSQAQQHAAFELQQINTILKD
jgi:CubicO group peptidase (beta-lactamase class C family)